MSQAHAPLGKYEIEQHVSPVSTYWYVFGALLVLTLATVGVSRVAEAQDWGSSLSLGVAMSVAVVKAFLVMYWFMHLKYDTKLNWFVFGSAFWFMAIFFTFIMFDLGTRGQVNPLSDNFVPGQEQPPDSVVESNKHAAEGGAEADHGGGHSYPTREPRCRCGYTRDHLMVSAKRVYSGWGWFWLMFGSSYTPKKIVFECRVCKQTLGETSDPDELARYL